MSALRPEQTRALAQLARLSLSEAEVAQFSPQLEKILDYIEQLEAVDLRDVPEYTSPPMPGSALRQDEAGDMLERSEALAPVPVTRDGLVVVPKFKED